MQASSSRFLASTINPISNNLEVFFSEEININQGEKLMNFCPDPINWLELITALVNLLTAILSLLPKKVERKKNRR